MSKYKLKTLALLSALPILFTACTLQDLPLIGGLFGGVNSNAPVELTMWGLWEQGTTLAPLVADFQTKFPNATLKYDDMSVLKLNGLVDYKTRVFSRMEQSSWDADVVMIHNSWVSRLAKAGFLEPMPESLMSPAGYSQTYYPVSSTSGIVDGQVYAVPAYYDGLVLVYNKDHFDEIGQINPPTAWEEFRRVAIDLTVLSEGVGAQQQVLRGGAAVGGADNIGHFSDILGLMWKQAGVSIPDGIDSVPAQDALSFYTSLLKDHKVWRNDFPEATTAFVNKQVSMIFVPSWQVLDILKAAPDMNIGIAPVPQALASSPVTWGSFWMYVVPKNSDATKQVSWEFINYLGSQDGERALFNSASKDRPFGPAYARVDLASTLTNHEYLGPLVKTAPFAQSAEIAGRSGNRLQEEELKKAVNTVLSGDLTVEEALKAAKETLNF